MSVIAGSVKHNVGITDTLAAGTTRPSAVEYAFRIEKSVVYTNGSTAANQANRTYYFSGTATATPTTINLSTIVCADGSVGMTHVRELWIYNDDTVDTETLTCFGGTTPFAPHLAGTTPTQVIWPGGLPGGFSKPLGVAGHAVSTNVNVKIDPGAATVPFRVYILGYS
jgi:hypothetical protein